jgi:hypothetical protein
MTFTSPLSAFGGEGLGVRCNSRIVNSKTKNSNNKKIKIKS